jgi:ribonuclease BN (tRNA processing enzyme)
MALNVTVLGCSGTYAGPGGACSGYLVRNDDTTVWVDAGSGTLANLQRHAELGEVDAIILSHEHPDHWTDLEGYYNACRFVLERRGVPVYAPAGVKDRTYDDDTSPYLEWHDVSGGDRVRIGTLAVTFFRTDHGPETLAMRIDSDRLSLGYSADTGAGWSIEALGPGLDLVLCEATLPRGFRGQLQHLTAEQAGASARDARVERLVITHLWPTNDAAQSQGDAAAAFGHDVIVAATNETYLA